MKSSHQRFLSSVHIVCLTLMAGICCAAAENDVIPLQGDWLFQFDPGRVGERESWYQTVLQGKIPLPGTTETAGLGEESAHRDERRLVRARPYNGMAWYQREIVIPEAWKDKRVILFLERTKISQVWLDDENLGTQNSLVAPHVYDLGKNVRPGTHRLTVMVKNADYPPLGDTHQLSHNTQTNWNGILGRIELIATDDVWIESARPFPDVDRKEFKVKVRLGNLTGAPVDGKITVGATMKGAEEEKRVPPVTQPFENFNTDTELEVTLPLGADAQTWDEFSPVTYAVEVLVEGTAGGKPFVTKSVVPAGLREFKAKGTQFEINGKVTFLRGKNDACVFPLTGHPPMDKEGWIRVMKISQSYGINHYRFHSWCPPEAAFEAADELGIYMQPELPNWRGFGGQKEHHDFMVQEGRGIMNAFGNHPSFVMFALGNELAGSREIMAGVVEHFRKLDPRRLYAQGSNNFHATPRQSEGDDFWVTMSTRSGTMWKNPGDTHVRGSFSYATKPSGIIQTGPADTLADFSEAAAVSTIPVVGHETGQYSIFPDLNEIPKYTGVLRARSLEIIRDRLKEKGMLEQADDFTLASGRLSALCYKAEMEMALRTPGFGGFQLLDLQDFPGQGVATIGVLNAFMESKGVTTPEEWTNSCSASTLLARFPGYVWTADQHFKAAVELAHYGKGNLTDATVRWALRDSQGGVVASGTLGSVDVPQGTLAPLGTVEFGFAQLKEVPARLNLELGLVGTSITNEYPLWVYPSKVESQPQPMVRSSLDEAAIKELKRGGAVILLRSGASPGSTAMMFTPDFWAYDLFKRENPPGTMGLLMDPEHPALAKFPTEYHSNWQWFDISNASWPMILDEMPAGYRPIVQVIDNFTRCHRLGLVSEFKCDGGRLLVVSCDLEKLASNAAARQLMTSLVSYVQSEAFNPQYELPPTLRDGLAITNLALGKPAKATGSREGDDNSPSRAVDGDESTFWLAPDAKPGYSWQVDLGVAANVEQCELTFETAEKYSYVLEGSPDGAQWFPLADTTKDENNQARHAYQIQQKGLRYLRVTFHDTPRWWGSLREFKAFGTPASSE